MKTIIQKTKRHLCALAGLLLVSGALPASAQSPSPVGPVWDVVITGPANGVAYLTFSDSGEICGLEILSPKASGGTDGPADERYSGNENVRNPGDAPSTNSISKTNVLYGAYPINGWWSYDIQGRIVGGWGEVGSRIAPTLTEVVLTNVFGEITTNYVLTTAANAITNNVSIRGKVSSTGRLSMTGFSGIGRVNYRGIQMTQLPDLNGPWLGDTKRGGQTFLEVFSMTLGSDAEACSLPYYEVCGQGPAYAFSGVALISNQKRLALNTSWDGQSETIARSVTGPFNTSRWTATLKGGEDPKHRVTLKVSPLMGSPPPLPCGD